MKPGNTTISGTPFGRLRYFMAMVMVAGMAGFLAWVTWICLARDDVYFLERHAPAQWIRYPKAAQCLVFNDCALSAAFRRDFLLTNSPASAKLSIRAFTRWSLSINGAVVGQSIPGKDALQRGEASAVAASGGNHWKEAVEMDVARFLRPGTNEIVATVFNTNGPPALWLALDAGEVHINSGPDWTVSLMDAATEPAVIADAPVRFGRGNPMLTDEAPLPSLRKHFLTLAVLAVLSAALVAQTGGWVKRYRERIKPRGAPGAAIFKLVPVIIPAMLWAVLFMNNHRFLTRDMGYDSGHHLDYVYYLSAFKKLPLATDGWQMYQPPLYYLICATLLLPFSKSIFSPGALGVLRAFDGCVGVAHFVIVFLCLRLLFPGRVRLQWFGLLLAAFLPAILGMSQFVTNECLAAMLFSAAVYFCLRILKEDSNSTRLFVGFGLCLGATLLTKFTGLIGIPVFAAALLSRPLFNRRFPSRIRVSKVLLGFGVAVAVCGWHYLRVWRHFGNPLVGNWDAVSGHNWWMEDGYHTCAWFFRFGACLSYPWFSGINGFADGLYSTLWGDGMWSGMVDTIQRPAWNYEMMAVGYLFALLPMLLVLVGTVVSVRRWIRRPEPTWFVLIGVAFLTLAAIIFMTVKLPSYAQVKAFYGMISFIPLCAFGAAGWDFILRRSKVIAAAAAILMGVWAGISYVSFWVRTWDPEAHLALGQYLQTSGNRPGAIAQYEEAVRLAPHSIRARNRAALHFDRDNPPEMMRLLRLNLTEAPEDADTHLLLGIGLAEQGKYDEALAQAKQAAALAPEQPALYAPYVNICLKGGHNREAAEAGRAGLRVRPFDAELQDLTGKAFVAGGDATNAWVYFEHAVTLKPDWPNARDDLGMAMLNMHKGEEALRELAVAVKAKPDNAAFHYHKALALAAAGRKPDAIAECRRALELDGGLSAARETLKTLELEAKGDNGLYR